MTSPNFECISIAGCVPAIKTNSLYAYCAGIDMISCDACSKDFARSEFEDVYYLASTNEWYCADCFYDIANNLDDYDVAETISDFIRVARRLNVYNFVIVKAIKEFVDAVNHRMIRERFEDTQADMAIEEAKAFPIDG